MKHMGEDYLYYPISKTFTQYYTRANTMRFGRKGCQIFSIAPDAWVTRMRWLISSPICSPPVTITSQDATSSSTVGSSA